MDLNLTMMKKICSKFKCAERTEDVLKERKIEVEKVRGKRVMAEILRVTLGRCFKCGESGTLC